MNMIKSTIAALAVVTLASGPAYAAGGAPKPPAQDWSFKSLFGTFDRAAAQRGFQVYTEVCASCHSLNLLSYRHLAGIGFPEDEIKAIASQVEVTDGPNDEGEMFDRAGIPADRFVSPFPNAKAAAASNNGKAPPDLSLMTKARFNGHDYLYALLTGYEDTVSEATLKEVYAIETETRMKKYETDLEAYEEAKEAGQNVEEPEKPKPVTSIDDLNVPESSNFNAYFGGWAIAMAAPLSEDAVEYADGTKATVEQMSKDVTVFLAWAAEPEMEERKSMGIKVMLFLLILTGMLYAVKRQVWRDQH